MDSEVLEVKVPLAFLGTGGFSLRREGRYPKRRENPAPKVITAGAAPECPHQQP